MHRAQAARLPPDDLPIPELSKIQPHCERVAQSNLATQGGNSHTLILPATTYGRPDSTPVPASERKHAPGADVSIDAHGIERPLIATHGERNPSFRVAEDSDIDDLDAGSPVEDILDLYADMAREVNGAKKPPSKNRYAWN